MWVCVSECVFQGLSVCLSVCLCECVNIDLFLLFYMGTGLRNEDLIRTTQKMTLVGTQTWLWKILLSAFYFQDEFGQL